MDPRSMTGQGQLAISLFLISLTHNPNVNEIRMIPWHSQHVFLSEPRSSCGNEGLELLFVDCLRLSHL